MKTKIKQVTAATLIVLSLMGIGINASATELTGCRVVESSLELEDWMTDETFWSTANIFAQETDENLLIEDWMTSENTWFVVEKAIEPELALENWMIDTENWNVDEPVLALEVLTK
ncbi:hypothetical protein [uncultured Draconibacterium sp.]|uniref:hypothetical protein n=1 Tax=uncultured Draconibacterium sp. TaxID=1573823 RepID=UPI0029C7F478|nr:hypothetical protein [uncultured Draconibacterium sp.]